jgi:hypothetical protein
MSTGSVRRKAFAGLVVAGAVTLPVGAPAGAHVPPGPGGKGTPSICVQVPAVKVTTPAGGPGYGFVAGPPASDRAYEHVSCPPPE